MQKCKNAKGRQTKKGLQAKTKNKRDKFNYIKNEKLNYVSSKRRRITGE